jgi:hypothetical protein
MLKIKGNSNNKRYFTLPFYALKAMKMAILEDLLKPNRE